MCGIAGIVGRPRERDNAALSRPLLALLRHRGPDDHGWLVADNAGFRRGRGACDGVAGDVLLLHRRLSILDLSDAGWQPMTTPDGRYALTFNGEIYNYLELRAELEREGVAFRSNSDTEVLLHAFAVWGVAALPRLVGMFAFAVYDRVTGALTLARDPFGIKPLYYAVAADGLAFASEVKALLALPGVTKAANPRRLYEYLVSGRTDHGDETMFAGVRQLPAACTLTIPTGATAFGEPRCYWSIDLADRIDLPFDEAAARVRDLFLENVRLHLRSDVPVGAALSGGIDSSAIVAAMRALEPKLDLHTFSYIADDKALSEERWVDLVAADVGSSPYKIHATPGELADDLDGLVYSQDEPFGSTSIYVQHRVFRRAAEAGIKVMLDGQGADEMLAGYRPYLAARLASLIRGGRWLAAVRFLRRVGGQPGVGSRYRLLLQAAGLLVPGQVKAFAKQALHGSLSPAWLNAGWFAERGVRPFDLGGPATADVLRGQLHRSVTHTSLPMLLRYEDRNSMAHSIESRVPFLTPKLANFLLRLPEDYLLGPEGTSKRVFRAALRGLVPDAILDRTDKIGFATPERRWFAALRPQLEATFQSAAATMIPALNMPGVLREWDAVLAGTRPFDFRVWRWVNVIRWAERFEVSFAG